MKVLVFAGTTEGSTFVCRALAAGHAVTASVATAYGAETLARHVTSARVGGRADAATPVTLRILHGRLDADAMTQLVPSFDVVVDATHPYAVQVTQNVARACGACGVPLYRLLRPRSPVPRDAHLREFGSLDELVQTLCALPENNRIFLATGSRDLARFSVIPRYAERLFVRVLPSVEALDLCAAAGIPASHIVAVQGACSVALNEALFREYGCAVLVTKESGTAGGFAEKLAAAARCGMEVYALTPPEERHERAFSSVDALLSALAGRKGEA